MLPLVEVLSQNSIELAGSLPHVIGEGSDVSEDVVVVHQNAAKQYVHLLYLTHSKVAAAYQQIADAAGKRAMHAGEGERALCIAAHRSHPLHHTSVPKTPHTSSLASCWTCRTCTQARTCDMQHLSLS